MSAPPVMRVRTNGGAVQLLDGPKVGKLTPIPIPSGKRRSFFVFTPFARAATRFAVSWAAMFAGSLLVFVFVVNDLCVLLPADKAMAGKPRSTEK